MTTRNEVDLAIHRVTDAADAFAFAVAHVQTLEDQRPLLKAECIAAMLGTPNPLGKPGALHSASSAAEVVEQDARYMAHRKEQSNAEVEKIRAHGAYKAAQLSARNAMEAYWSERRAEAFANVERSLSQMPAHS